MIYDIGFFIFALFSLPHFLGRLRQAEDPGRLVRERLGFFPTQVTARFEGRRTLWIHCVSVGEVLAVEKLIRLILAKKPDLYIVLTTVTPTGQRIAKQLEGERVSVHYFPLDFRFAVGKFLDFVKPVCLLLTETEIWPNVIKEAKRRKIPIAMVNGRLSERSFQAFQRFSAIFKPLLTDMELFLVQTDRDQERLAALGVKSSKIAVTGNMKLDAFDVNGQPAAEPKALRERLGFPASDQVLIGGSTHAGEEEILLRAVRRLKDEGFPLRFLLAPRHVERSQAVLKQAKKFRLNATLTSERHSAPPFEVLILDELGQLRKLYAIGDIVVMGGSFVRHGGQNPVEPAAVSRAIIHGPWVFNFHDIYRRLDEDGGSLCVKGEEELVFALRRLLASERERQHIGTRAHEVLKRLRGASERNFDRIHYLLEE